MKKFIAFILLWSLCISSNFIHQVKADTTTAPHWQQTTIPVYIQTDEKSAMMKRAFLRWQNETGGKIKFAFVAKEAAKVEVIFTDKVNGSDGPFGAYSINTSGNNITSAKISFATKAANSKNYTSGMIYANMLHEVGHILGLSDSPRKKSSIMYMPTPESKDILKLDVRNLYNVNGWSYSNRRFAN